MIGNDIVDLNRASVESDWRRPRFLPKIFSTAEQEMITTAEHQSQMVWLLWSMKEASYKIFIQQHGLRFFNPSQIRSKLTSENKGVVTCNGNRYVTQSKISTDYIHTIAYLKQLKPSLQHHFRIENATYKAQSQSVRKQLLASLSELKKVSIDNLAIKNDAHNVPRLFHKGKLQNESISITHHGHYGAYAIAL